jgi:hypothetical protein
MKKVNKPTISPRTGLALTHREKQQLVSDVIAEAKMALLPKTPQPDPPPYVSPRYYTIEWRGKKYFVKKHKWDL